MKRLVPFGLQRVPSATGERRNAIGPLTGSRWGGERRQTGERGGSIRLERWEFSGRTSQALCEAAVTTGVLTPAVLVGFSPPGKLRAGAIMVGGRGRLLLPPLD